MFKEKSDDRGTLAADKFADFKIGKQVFKNSYFEMFMCECKDNQTFILKKLLHTVNTHQSLAGEKQIIKELDHQNICKLQECSINDTEPLMIALQTPKGGFLQQEISFRKTLNQTFCEQEAAKIMNQIFFALNYLHKTERIVHRFVTPDSVAFKKSHNTSQILLYQFSIAERLQSDDDNYIQDLNDDFQKVVREGFVGIDRFYISPETRKRFKYGYKSDIWNCGLILFLLLSGNLPFDTQEDLENNYYEDQYEDDIWKGISVQAKDLIDNLLEENFNDRFSALQALRHPWIVKNSPAPDIQYQDEDFETVDDQDFQDRMKEVMNKKRWTDSTRNTVVEKDSSLNKPGVSKLSKSQESGQFYFNAAANNNNQQVPSSFQNSTDKSKLITKILTIHKKGSQIYLKSLFQEIDEDDDYEISQQNVRKHLPCLSNKIEELFSFGESSERGTLTFAQFIMALRSFIENDLTEWMKMAADESQQFTLENYKHILSQSKFFPISQDLDEIFRELSLYLENQNAKQSSTSRQKISINKKSILNRINTVYEQSDQLESESSPMQASPNIRQTFSPGNIARNESTMEEGTATYIPSEFIGHLMKMGKKALKNIL